MTIALTATLVLLLVAAVVIIMQARQARGLRHQADDLVRQIDDVRTNPASAVNVSAPAPARKRRATAAVR